MNNKENTYFYSQNAADTFGYYLAEKNDGTIFKYTAYCDKENKEKFTEDYKWKDKQITAECSYDDIKNLNAINLSTENERGIEVKKNFVAKGEKINSPFNISSIREKLMGQLSDNKPKIK